MSKYLKVLIIFLILVTMLQSIAYADEITSDLVPKMTSNNAPNGVASASSIWSTGHQPYRVFDKVDTDNGWSTIQGVTTGWIAYEFDVPTIVNDYVLRARSHYAGDLNGQCPKNWTFEGWDGTNWVVLDSRTNISGWKLGLQKEFAFSNQVAYKKYRLNISENNGYKGFTTLGEFQMKQKMFSDPKAPLNLYGKTDNVSNQLIWDTVSDAVSYNLKRSLTVGGPYTTISTVTTTTYIDTNLEPNLTYYYVVTAINNAGSESSNSNEVSLSTSVTQPINNNRALLTITLVNGLEQEYDLSMTEVEGFISWYNDVSDGTKAGVYAFEKTFNLANFLSRKEYISFSKIEAFEVSEYEID